jgi:hypothetical protein
MPICRLPSRRSLQRLIKVNAAEPAQPISGDGTRITGCPRCSFRRDCRIAKRAKLPTFPSPHLLQTLPTGATGLVFVQGRIGSMFRVRFVVSAATVAISAALAACSSTPSWVPDWMSAGKSTPQLVTMQFESQPQGADVRTGQGQTCQTPCSLALQPQPQAISFSKNGFLPQTVQVAAGDPPEHSLFESPPPTLTPNPVTVVLQPAGPPHGRPGAKPRAPRVAHTAPPPPPQ